jgi:hypothetical protein
MIFFISLLILLTNIHISCFAMQPQEDIQKTRISDRAQNSPPAGSQAVPSIPQQAQLSTSSNPEEVGTTVHTLYFRKRHQ